MPGHTSFFGAEDYYSLAQEQADARETIAQMERDGLLRDRLLREDDSEALDEAEGATSQYEILDEFEVLTTQMTTLQSDAGSTSAPLILNFDANEDEIDKFVSGRQLNSTQSEDLGDTRQQQKSKSTITIDDTDADQQFSIGNILNSQTSAEAQHSYYHLDSNRNMDMEPPNLSSSQREHSNMQERAVGGRYFGSIDSTQSESPTLPLPANRTASRLDMSTSAGAQHSYNRLDINRNMDMEPPNLSNSQRELSNARDRAIDGRYSGSIDSTRSESPTLPPPVNRTPPRAGMSTSAGAQHSYHRLDINRNMDMQRPTLSTSQR